jgi:hypothetical protein
MAISKTDICNAALTKLGQAELITNIDEGTPNANALRAAWDIARDATLRDFDWGFAMTRQTLAVLEDEPLSEIWEYQYQLPTVPLYLRIVDIPDYDPLNQPPYEIEGDVLLTNETEITIRYIAQITDTAKYPADFANALAARLAFEVATVVTQSRGAKQLAAAEYASAISDAKGTAALEQKSKPARSTWADR